MLRAGLVLILVALCPLPMVAALTWQGSSAAGWHGNVTNADRASDRLPALQSEFNIEGTTRHQLSGSNIVSAGLHLGLDLWPEYEGLDSISIGPVLGLTHKFGLGSQAWVFSARATGDWVNVNEADRSGLTGEIQLEVGKRVGGSWQFLLGTTRSRHEARGHAFSTSGRENYFRTEYQVNPLWRIAVELRQRAGVVVSYTTPPRPDLVQAGKVLTLVDTFERGTPLLAYYFPADTTSGSIELTRSLGAATSAFVRFEYRETTHFDLRYLNQRSTVGVIHRF